MKAVNHELKLIDGTFIPSEAEKIIVALISSKINHHSMEAFSIKERFSGDVSHLEKRIEELKSVNVSFKKLTKFATAKGLKLKIKSVVQVSFVK